MKRKHSIGIVLLALIFLVSSVHGTFALEEKPEIKSEAAILMDARSGDILFEKNIDQPLHPASLTKILTAIIVLEQLEVDQVITVDAQAAQVGGATMNLKAGEQVSVEQLLHGMLICSANDAAAALALEISGSIEEFSLLMNEKALELGAENTHFVSPNGLTDNPAHQTTAKDMVLITRAAMEYDIFADIVKKESYEMGPTNLSEARVCESTNKLLYDEKTKVEVNGKKRSVKYKHAIGVKTGTTDLAGYCLAAAATKEETTLIAICLKAEEDEQRYQDSLRLLEYGFNNFHSVNIMEEGESCGQIKVKYGHQTKANTAVSTDIIVTLPREGLETVTEKKIILDDKVEAPVKKGTKVGVVEVYEGDEKIRTVDVVLDETVEKGGPWARFYISDLMAQVIAIALGLLLALFLTIKAVKARNRRKRALLLQRQREKKKERLQQEQEYKRRRNWPY